MQKHPLSDGILYSSWKDVKDLPQWGARWHNFEPWEFASRDTGEFYWHPRSFDAIQRARTMLGAPVVVNSAHRTWVHNIAVGGAPRSAHLWVAFDISTRKHNLATLYTVLRAAGFKSFGFYTSFIHVDLRPGRMWYGSKEAKAIWQPIVNGDYSDVVEL